MAVPRFVFMAVLPVTHALTRSPKLERLSRPAMRLFGWSALAIGNGKAQQELSAIGKEWHRLFPLGKDMPITGVDGDTLFAEIHIRCPYRGSGNVHGCYRMMEYDRRILERVGGQLVVLQSQAEPGVTSCKLAIRKLGVPTADLEHAHDRLERAES